MKKFKKYIEGKGLRLSPEKSKVLVFEKGRGGTREKDWKWGEENIEEVKEIKYLVYVMQKNGGVEKHIPERMRRAMKQAWSIGERIFKENYKRRMKMFRALVGNVALYGAEIWGWRNEKRIDRIKRKYTKWILDLDRSTPNYILIEEMKMEELSKEALRRAFK